MLSGVMEKVTSSVSMVCLARQNGRWTAAKICSRRLRVQKKKETKENTPNFIYRRLFLLLVSYIKIFLSFLLNYEHFHSPKQNNKAKPITKLRPACALPTILTMTGSCSIMQLHYIFVRNFANGQPGPLYASTMIMMMISRKRDL